MEIPDHYEGALAAQMQATNLKEPEPEERPFGQPFTTITTETTWDTSKMQKGDDGRYVPFLAHTGGNLTAESIHTVDPNPPTYPSKQERSGWDLQDYREYMEKIPKFQEESLDDDVIDSRRTFWQDYYARCEVP